MPRPKKSVPAYSRHKPSGQAVVKLTLPDGTRRTVYLGKYDSPESRAEYARLVAGGVASPPGPAGMPAGGGLTVNEVLVRWFAHADRHYRHPDGRPTNEVANYKMAARPLKELSGFAPAVEFGPLALKAVRRRMVERGWCRGQVNAAVGRVKRVFKWAASEELVPPAVYHALATVAGLQRGRTEARDPEPVGPVPDGQVDAVLPHLPRPVRGLVEFQRLTGCRPGEACGVRRSDLDMGGPVWVYRPAHHKNAHRGQSRAVALGPKTQALLTEFFRPDRDAYLFDPRDAVAERKAARSAARVTPLYPSHVRRKSAVRAGEPRCPPAERYTPHGYANAIRRAVRRLNRESAAAAGIGNPFNPVPHWHPNQLRHTFATAVRRQFGLEAAQALLGHSKCDTTQVYAERNDELATSVAARVG